jgi:putative transposase
MGTAKTLSHTRWESKFHLVRVPKFRRKVLYGQLRTHLGEILRDLAYQKESRILEGYIQPGHVYMLVSIPPKYSGSSHRLCRWQGGWDMVTMMPAA